jgi:ribosomal protein L11 methyltransferase
VWLARMEAHGEMNWLIIEKPQRVRLLIEVYFSTRAEAQALADAWGGQVCSVSNAQPKQEPGPPMRVSDTLEIRHEAPGRRSARGNNRLYIPYGMAFGSGEHATTWMLLRALARRGDWAKMTLLDLGTGSGVLALAARKLGAREIVGTDFDPDAVRTARQIEALNFTSAAVRWECADVKRLHSTKAYSLIVANLFSGILCEAASRIARALRPGGELWLSGILRTQQGDVAVAYRGARLRLVKTTTRGKWVMQQWQHSS